MKNTSKYLRRILFIDIETASEESSYEQLDRRTQLHWQDKAHRLIRTEKRPLPDNDYSMLYLCKSAIYAEFARVICISVGYLYESAEERVFKIKSFHNDSEKELLIEFHKLLNEFYTSKTSYFLCGHNIKEFDVPFVCRRSIVNGLDLPDLLDVAGFKPWQMHHLLDTMEMWKFGDYKHYTSLDLLCSVLGIHTPKGDMNGSQVNEAYWSQRLQEIVVYCQRDVVATAKVFLRCAGIETFSEDDVVVITNEPDNG